MRFPLRTLLIVLAVALPPFVAYCWWALALREADRQAMRRAYERANAVHEAP